MKNISITCNKHRGFSLVEILVVLVIIGLLTAGVAGKFIGETDKARVKRVRSDLKNIETALSRYKLDNFKFPTSEQGLEALVERPSAEPIPKQWPEEGYLNKLPKDPWENPYV